VNEDEEGTKNNYEGELLGELLKRYGRDIRYSYLQGAEHDLWPETGGIVAQPDGEQAEFHRL